MLAVVAMIRPGVLLQGRYRVVRQIGGGGFGQVFEVDDGDSPKVLKVLCLERFHNPAIKNKAIALFQREAQLLHRLNHPGIPKVEDQGYFTWSSDSGELLHCLVMEKIPGCNLQEWLHERGHQPITSEQAKEWLTQLVEILDKLHQQQYFHRDIKLSNIMLKPDGQLVLIDFGAVREVTNTYLRKHQGQQTGTVLISPGYTPPEQAEGYAVPQSDFFALGRTFVCLLTGKSPLDFPKDSHTGKLIWRDQAPEVSPLLADLIDCLMASFPGQRPQSCQEILDYLAGNKLNFDTQEQFAQTIPPDTSLIPEKWQEIAHTIPGDNFIFDNQKPANFKEIPRRQKTNKLVIASLLAIASFNLWQSSPNIAYNLTDQGFANSQHKNLDIAELHYRFALLFQPKMAEANYNLGMLYEDQNKLSEARAAYKIAVQQGFDKAYNNLARLEILDKQYTTAVSLLQKGLPLADDDKVKYAMLKNLGWANLELGHYQEAQNYLQQAINIKSDRAAAYCLQGKIFERQQNKQSALSAWKNCIKYSKSDNSATTEEQQWKNEAEKNIEKINLESTASKKKSRNK
ncbi:MAG: protein kinase [Heteroscytonema crispum UTEX LB 1556]